MAAVDQKRNRVVISKRCLERFKHNPKDPLGGKRFGSIEVIDAVNGYFEERQSVLYRRHEKHR